MTNCDEEGIVIKPLELLAKGQRGMVHPAIACCGQEYLRIIYSPEYTLPEHLERLRRVDCPANDPSHGGSLLWGSKRWNSLFDEIHHIVSTDACLASWL